MSHNRWPTANNDERASIVNRQPTSPDEDCRPTIHGLRPTTEDRRRRTDNWRPTTDWGSTTDKRRLTIVDWRLITDNFSSFFVFFVFVLCSTSPPGGNQVDGSPPASQCLRCIERCFRFCRIDRHKLPILSLFWINLNFFSNICWKRDWVLAFVSQIRRLHQVQTMARGAEEV